MKIQIFYVSNAVILFICALKVNGDDVDNENFNFPLNFSFGVSTAAYQIEGAWNLDGKGPSIWDTFTHKYPNRIVDHSNGDVGPDSYHQFHQDLNALKYLGVMIQDLLNKFKRVQFYRFSISWARILPNGDKSSLNQAGINYYNDIINKLIGNNIKPMVTMYHYDLPDEIQKIGGLTNPLFVKYFEEYARILYTYFGDRVEYWITFNEPYDYCVPGYGTGKYPPLIDASGVADYLCIDNTIKAHAVAYRLYKKYFHSKYKGKIGITMSSRFYFSKTDDQKLVNRGLQFGFGWIAHPIYSENGGYPQIMIDVIGNNSKQEGRAWSRLPEMSDHWKNLIKGTGDFIGLNYYTSRFIEEDEKPTAKVPSWQHDANFKVTVDPKWKRAISDWLYSVPEGLRNLLGWIKNEYDNIEIIITECGWSEEGRLNDYDRIEYLRDHLVEVSKAIKDGCNVSGFIIWSLIDNFEWLRGYSEKFGLYYVNLTSPNKERIPKKSVEFVRSVIKAKNIPSSSFSSVENNDKSVVIL